MDRGERIDKQFTNALPSVSGGSGGTTPSSKEILDRIKDLEARRSGMSDAEYRHAKVRIQAAAGNVETRLPPDKKPPPVRDNKFETKQVLFKYWRPEMGLPAVKPEYWSPSEWANAVAFFPERNATPLWVEALVGIFELGAASARGLKVVWDTFREGYESAYENAKRASEESNNRGTNSSCPNEPANSRPSPYDVLGVRENAPWSEVDLTDLLYQVEC